MEEVVLVEGRRQVRDALVLMLVFFVFSFAVFIGVIYSEKRSLNDAVSSGLFFVCFIGLIYGALAWLFKKAEGNFLSASRKGVTMAGSVRCARGGLKIDAARMPYWSGGETFVPAGRIAGIKPVAVPPYNAFEITTTDGFEIVFYSAPPEEVWRKEFEKLGLLK